MKKLIFLFLLCLAVVGCSNESKTNSNTDILSNVAEFNFQQSFDLSEEQSVTMFVEVYENEIHIQSVRDASVMCQSKHQVIHFHGVAV